MNYELMTLNRALSKQEIQGTLPRIQELLIQRRHCSIKQNIGRAKTLYGLLFANHPTNPTGEYKSPSPCPRRQQRPSDRPKNFRSFDDAEGRQKVRGLGFGAYV